MNIRRKCKNLECVSLVLGALIFSFALSPLTAHGEQVSIIGVWKPVKYEWTDEGKKKVNDNPQPGLFIAAAKFYSTTLITSEETRQSEPAGVGREDYTHEQLKSMSVPFHSNAGTYALEKNRFVFDPVVALNQNFQESGEHSIEFEINTDGTTLVFIGRDESALITWRNTFMRLE